LDNYKEIIKDLVDRCGMTHSEAEKHLERSVWYPGRGEYATDADELVTGEKAINDFGLEKHNIFKAVFEGRILAYKPACVFRPGFWCMGSGYEIKKTLSIFRKEGYPAVFPTINPDYITLEKIEEYLFKREDIEALRIGDGEVESYGKMAECIEGFEMGVDINKDKLKRWKSKKKYGLHDLIEGLPQKDNKAFIIKKIDLYRWAKEYEHVLPKKSKDG